MSTAVTAPTGTWNVDPSHSRIGFAVKHLGISTVRGAFGDFEGRLEIGIGAGWMIDDYTKAGMTYDRAGVRIDRP